MRPIERALITEEFDDLDTSKANVRRAVDEFILEKIKGIKSDKSLPKLADLLVYSAFMSGSTGQARYSSLKCSLEKAIYVLDKKSSDITTSDLTEFSSLMDDVYSFRKEKVSLLQIIKECMASKNALKIAGMSALSAAVLPFIAAGALYAVCAVKPLNWVGGKLPFLNSITYNYNLVRDAVKDVNLAPTIKSTKVMSKDGVVLGEYFVDKKDPVASIDEIPRPIISAVCAMEDQSFYTDAWYDLRRIGPFDFVGLSRAVLTNFINKYIKGSGRLVGGSTIEMQTVEAIRKDLAQRKDIKKTSKWSQKIAELMSSINLCFGNSRDDIMKKYLDEVYFGQKSYGINVAVKSYLNMSLEEFKQLPIQKQLAYSAMFSAIPKGPTDYDPILNPKKNEVRAGFALRNLAKLNPDLKPVVDEIYDLKSSSWKISLDELVASTELNNITTYPGDYAIGLLQAQDPKGYNKGYTVNTTIDSKVQGIVEDAFDDHVKRLRQMTKMEIDGAALVLNSKTGDIVAMVGGYWVNYEPRGLNRVLSDIQVGSLAKVPTFLLSLNSGRYSPNSTVMDIRYDFNGYSPQNYDGKYRGAVSLKYALAHSLNTVGAKLFANLISEYGIQEYINFLESLGVTANIRKEVGEGLGRWNSSLFEMVGMFSSINNEGVFVQPHIFKSVVSHEGKVRDYSFDGIRKFDSKVAKQMESMLEYVVQAGTGKIVGKGGGKTGTTDDCRAAWYIGNINDYTIGAVVFNDQNLPMYLRDNSVREFPLFKNDEAGSVVYVGDTVNVLGQRFYRMFNDTSFTDTLKDYSGSIIIRKEMLTPNSDIFYSLNLDSLGYVDTLLEVSNIRALGIYGNNGAGLIVRDIVKAMKL